MTKRDATRRRDLLKPGARRCFLSSSRGQGEGEQEGVGGGAKSGLELQGCHRLGFGVRSRATPVQYATASTDPLACTNSLPFRGLKPQVSSTPTLPALALVAALWIGCSGPDTARRPAGKATDEFAATVPASNRAMARRLARLLEGDGEASGAFNMGRLVEVLRSRELPIDLKRRTGLHLRLGQALLFNGQTEEAIGEFEAASAAVAASAVLFAPPFRRNVESLLAIAYLRQGEERNCLLTHNSDSCLLPLSAGGVHRDPRGAQRALEVYLRILAADPDDLESRWLLNIAAMALGEHPEAVPARWRIARSSFDSQAPLSRFVDVAPAAGLDVTALSGGVAMEDFTGDGLLDLMVSSWLLSDPLRFFVNLGDGTFAERTREAGLEGLNGGLNLVHADYDNDGFADLLVLRGAWLGAAGHYPNSLLRNRGDGTFEDVTEAVGLLDFHPTQTAGWADFDGDGRLDLFVGNESTWGEDHPCQLFQQQPNGTFLEVAAEVGLAVGGMVKGVAWGDYDNDLRPDLYISRLGSENMLLHNGGPTADGGWSFREVTATAGVGEPRHSFPTWFFDYDNDGWLDLFVSGYPESYLTAGVEAVVADHLGLPTSAARPRLYRNTGEGSFEEVSAEAGVDGVFFTMGSNFGDLDNDGWLDLYLATGAPDYRALMANRMLRNDRGRRFQDVTTVGGFGHLQKGHAVAFGDLDNDGDQDVYAVMGGAYPGDVYPNALFENPGGGGNWVTLRLEGLGPGAGSNRSAIGARIAVVVASGDGERTIHATVGTGGSFGSASLQQEIGLGVAKTIRRLEVVWPSGDTQRFEGLAVNRFYALREGDPEPIAVSLDSFQLGGGSSLDDQGT